ncbi:acyl carrier protein [Umezawaea sp. Da 62-37]|uniref:acyl carrier protein n=1 Tax=Umezawaea sp. Da 62-37 TaxID=3075927 RepID=UPI0028F6CA51|nr:acyl carrier protein [Umezawaea sp. Da 62-37]WNV86238.1 acyl carrier protein [Umezawaea sp. Da 62-37]
MNTDIAVLDEIADMIREVIGAQALGDTPITMETTFQDDLAFESIDIVVLSDRVGSRYGQAVNLPRFLTELELDEIIALTVGRLVDHVEGCLAGRDA